MSDWKTIKIRKADYERLALLQEHLRQFGIGRLPTAARDQVIDGVSAGSVVGAALALLTDQLVDKPTRKPRRRLSQPARKIVEPT